MANTNNNNNKTYYEILEIDITASELDIKKAYRKLALKYHPDRSSATNSNKEEATSKFQEIGEAYECLSNPQTKREYDSYLKYNNNNNNIPNTNVPFTSYDKFSTATPPTHPDLGRNNQRYSRQRFQQQQRNSHFSNIGRRRYHHHHHHDPFAQFDHVFRTDPFFHDAFKDLDDEFARRFQNQQQQQGTGNHQRSNTNSISTPQPQQQS